MFFEDLGMWGCEFVVDLLDLGGFVMWVFVNLMNSFDFVVFCILGLDFGLWGDLIVCS